MDNRNHSADWWNPRHGIFSVDRSLAESQALELVKFYAEEWLSKEMPVLLYDLWENVAKDKILNVWIDSFNYEFIRQIGCIDTDIESVIELIKDDDNLEENKILLSEILSEKMCDPMWIKNIFLDKTDLSINYEKVLLSFVNTPIKKAWRTSCRIYVEAHKQDIKNAIDKFDSFWSSKISAEAIRNLDKDLFFDYLNNWIEKNVSQVLLDTVVKVLAGAINEYKEQVIYNIMDSSNYDNNID